MLQALQCAGSVWVSTHAPPQQTPPSPHAVPFAPQGVAVGLGVRLGVAVGLGVWLGVADGVGVGVPVGVGGTHVPFWQTCPTSSHGWQTWSLPQVSQRS